MEEWEDKTGVEPMKEYEKNNPDNLLKISGLEKEEPKEIDSEFYIHRLALYLVLWFFQTDLLF